MREMQSLKETRRHPQFDNRTTSSNKSTASYRTYVGQTSKTVTAESTPYAATRYNLINPDFSFVRKDYRVRVVHETNALHSKVDKLITSMYGARGLQVATAASYPSAPGRVTLAASSGHRIFGTLTLGMDTGRGLLADELYAPQINTLRRKGRQLCEVTRLAFEPDLSCQEVMATVFNVAFVLAREVHARTDLIAEVHPRHAPFYRRTLGYRVLGPVRACPRVQAPAVLLHLCLDFAKSQISSLAGTAPVGRSLYRHFLPASQQATLLKQLISTQSNA